MPVLLFFVDGLACWLLLYHPLHSHSFLPPASSLNQLSPSFLLPFLRYNTRQPQCINVFVNRLWKKQVTDQTGFLPSTPFFSPPLPLFLPSSAYLNLYPSFLCFFLPLPSLTPPIHPLFLPSTASPSFLAPFFLAILENLIVLSCILTVFTGVHPLDGIPSLSTASGGQTNINVSK